MFRLHGDFTRIKTRERNGMDEVFDSIRRKWLLLTPEEWVRQCLVEWLQQEKNVPKAYISIERKIALADRFRRIDLLVYGPDYTPRLLIECKSPGVPNLEAAAQQLLAYKSVLPCRFVMVSNGHHNLAWQIAEGRVWELDNLPSFEDWPD